MIPIGKYYDTLPYNLHIFCYINMIRSYSSFITQIKYFRISLLSSLILRSLFSVILKLIEFYRIDIWLYLAFLYCCHLLCSLQILTSKEQQPIVKFRCEANLQDKSFRHNLGSGFSLTKTSGFKTFQTFFLNETFTLLQTNGYFRSIMRVSA